MSNGFYTLPLKCREIIEKKGQARCGLTGSIRQHIHLLFRTHFKEYRYDTEFGNMVWEKDFETIRSIDKWKNELSEAFQDPIKKYEKRISQLNVNTNIDELKIVDPHTQKLIESRRRITIIVEGIINKTNEPFYHKEMIFFSPLSLT